MESVLVTGGAGYIGCLLVPSLLNKGYRVTIFDCLIFGAEPLLGFCSHPRLEIIRGDVRDAGAVAAQVKRHDWIVHLAAIVGFPACAAEPILAQTTNVDGTRNVVSAVSKGQRLLFASTGSTYGQVEGAASEETPINPLTLYGRTKRDAERILTDSGVPHVILRFATVFGSSPRMRLDLLVNDFVYQAIHNKQIILFEGHHRRTFLHSEDAAAVYPFAMERFRRMEGGVFNVGDESMNHTKKEIALRIKSFVDFYLHEADVGSDPDKRDYEVIYSKIKSHGYRSRISLDAGIEELIKILKVLTIRNPLRNA